MPKLKEERISRRTFLKQSTFLGTGLVLGINPEIQTYLRTLSGIIPRIVRVHSQYATSWDYRSNYYFDYVNQDVVNTMVLQGFLALVRGNFNAAIRIHNPGDKWAIKINCNNSADASNEIDASAPVLNAVLRLLINGLRVSPTDIYVYDASRKIPSFRLKQRIPFNVNFVGNGDPLTEGDQTSPIIFRRSSQQYLPYVVSNAQHLINIPLFKNHVLALGTMAMKNHFGTPKPGPSYMHSGVHENLSDLNACDHIRYKTRLIVGDALFGVWDGGPSGNPMQWTTFPGGSTPNSIFLGFDPVAHESVMTDYLIAEREYHGLPMLSHQYLHDAMRYNKLGVHGHRNQNGQYGRIDYYEMEI